MKREAIFDILFNDVPWICAVFFGIYHIVMYGLFSYVNLFGVHFHAASLFTIGTVYLLVVNHLRGLAVWWRPAVASLFIALGIHVYDVLWGLVSMLFRTSPLPLGGFLGAGLAALILWRLDRRLHFVNVRYSRLLAYASLCFAVLIMLGNGGYFQEMTLYDAGLGADPNVNVWWLVSKVCGLWIPLGLLGGDRP